MALARKNNQEITATNFAVVAKIEQLVKQAAPEAGEDLYDALCWYCLAYLEAFKASKGQLPSAKHLAKLAACGVAEVQTRQLALPANLTGDFLKNLAQQPRTLPPCIARVFGDNPNQRRYYELPARLGEPTDQLLAALAAALPDAEIDLNAGLATDTTDPKKQRCKIGKLLQREGHTSLLKRYEAYCSSASAARHMVISARGDDLARASTARNWSSCMAETGGNVRYLAEDHAQGTLVAYLTSAPDTELNRPQARALLKPYKYTVTGDLAYFPDNNYGTNDAAFKLSVWEWCQELNKGLPAGDYVLLGGLYRDGVTHYALDETGVAQAQDGNGTRHIPPHLRGGGPIGRELLAYLGYDYDNPPTDLDLSDMDLAALPTDLPAGLQTLYCANNQMSSLPATLPEGLRELYCHNNQLSSLPVTLPKGLQRLDCDNNQLSSLPATLPEGLRELICNNNQLSSLPATLPEGQQRLICNNNPLSSLPVTLPKGLQELDCENTQPTSLPATLPEGLRELYCHNNQLSSLPVTLPKGLQRLDCDNNQLSSLPATLPEGLRELYCHNNQLSSLPVTLPKGLQELDCENTQLTSLPDPLPAGLRVLQVRHNHFDAATIARCQALMEQGVNVIGLKDQRPVEAEQDGPELATA